MDKKALRRAEQILDAYYTYRLPAILQNDILDWFSMNGHVEEKYFALQKIFNKKFKYNPNPSEEAYESYEKIKDIIAKSRDDFYTSEYWNMKYKKRMKQKMILKVAAALIPAIMGIGLWFYYPAENNLPVASVENTVIVEVEEGTKDKADLNDGTQVWINENSELSYTDNRTASLTGEAYFSVAHDPENPFTLKTPHSTIRVYGTEFNVNDYPDEKITEITLYDGSIEVETDFGKYKMVPGENLIFSEDNQEFFASNTNTKKPAWMLSALNFVGTPLKDILKSLEWYYNVKFQYDETLDLSTPYWLSLSCEESISDVMSMLEAVSGDFHYNLSGDIILLETD